MKELNLDEVVNYVESNIGRFHEKRIARLDSLKLSEVLRRKNPYLFRAKNVLTSQEIVKGIVDAHISSNEETLFGDWLEGLAIFINSKVYGGFKSGIPGIDLEFDDNQKRYIVTIKSGPNWGNSSQITKMLADFKTAKKTMRTSNSKFEVVAVNGCCYGKDDTPFKGDYYKYCGKQFWFFISGNPDLYLQIIEPLGHSAKERNDDFNLKFNQKINIFVKQFGAHFVNLSGGIDWPELIRFNSDSESKKQILNF